LDEPYAIMSKKNLQACFNVGRYPFLRTRILERLEPDRNSG
jgi:hypothetical protein